jgi:hypothetical protein
MDVYLDTNLWNELCKQGAGADLLLPALEEKKTRLVVSDETIYELARTFLKPGQTSPREGAALFSHLKGFITRSVPIAKDNMALIAAEMQAVQWLMGEIFPFINASDYEIVRSMVDHLSNGHIAEDEVERINRRMSIRDFDRRGVVRFFESKPTLREQYQAITPEQFSGWLAIESRTPRAVEYLAGQIHSYFPKFPKQEMLEYARALQTAVANRASMGLIRRNIYINWRCAHRGSVGRDLFPDSTHILNASYSDIYATKEAGQAEYASHLLTPHTRVRIYDTLTPIAEWLLSLE